MKTLFLYTFKTGCGNDFWSEGTNYSTIMYIHLYADTKRVLLIVTTCK